MRLKELYHDLDVRIAVLLQVRIIRPTYEPSKHLPEQKEEQKNYPDGERPRKKRVGVAPFIQLASQALQRIGAPAAASLAFRVGTEAL